MVRIVFRVDKLVIAHAMQLRGIRDFGIIWGTEIDYSEESMMRRRSCRSRGIQAGLKEVWESAEMLEEIAEKRII